MLMQKLRFGNKDPKQKQTYQHTLTCRRDPENDLK